jgi:hypothetical protein
LRASQDGVYQSDHEALEQFGPGSGSQSSVAKSGAP